MIKWLWACRAVKFGTFGIVGLMARPLPNEEMQVRILPVLQILIHNNMVREITVDENYQTVRLFDAMKKGDIYKVPYNKKRHNGIKLEASRRNRDLRLTGVLKNKMDVKYRVSTTEYPGFSAIICLK